MLMMLLISPIEFLSPAHRPTALPRSVGDHSCLSMIQLNRHAYDIPQLSLVVDIEICFGRCRVRGFKMVRRLFVGFCRLMLACISARWCCSMSGRVFIITIFVILLGLGAFSGACFCSALLICLIV